MKVVQTIGNAIILINVIVWVNMFMKEGNEICESILYAFSTFVWAILFISLMDVKSKKL